MQLIDYTGDVPRSTGKFVHLIGPDDEYVVISQVVDTEYHAQIVARFCRDRTDVACVLSQSGDKAVLNSKEWRIGGGGRYRIDRVGQTLKLWGESLAYGAFDGSRIRAAFGQSPGWQRYEIRIGAPAP